MEPHIEISGGNVTCKLGNQKTATVGLADFLRNLREGLDCRTALEPVPDTVRFAQERSGATVLVMEQKPACRTLRWLKDDSRAPFGRAATYRDARVSLPYLVVVVAFDHGRLTGLQQCFYRREPLKNIEDELLLPNLPNVARAYGQTCWLCLANLNPDMSSLGWDERVRQIWAHVFEAGFNASSEHHEGNSYWQAMRSVDRRVATLEEWESQSTADPFFSLKVSWKDSGKTVRAVMEETVNQIRPIRALNGAGDLLPYFNASGKTAAAIRRGLFGK